MMARRPRIAVGDRVAVRSARGHRWRGQVVRIFSWHRTGPVVPSGYRVRLDCGRCLTAHPDRVEPASLMPAAWHLRRADEWTDRARRAPRNRRRFLAAVARWHRAAARGASS